MNLRTAPATVAVGTAALLLLSLAAWLLLLGPVLGQISETETAQTEARDRNDAISLQLLSLRKQADELPTTEAVADRIAEIWPPTADQPEFFAEVVAAAQDAGIEADDITALSPGVPVVVVRDAEGNAVPAEPGTEVVIDNRTVAVQTVTISATGGYEQVSRLLAGLETMPRALLTGSVQVTGAEEGYTVNLSGTTFVAPPLKPVKLS